MPVSTIESIVPRLSYVICTSPRSGSWLLSEGLQATELAGRPREWFHKTAESDRSRKWELPSESGYTEYVARVLRAATTPNGVFGLKCHWYQLQQLPDKLATMDGYRGIPINEALPRLLPNLRYIWLTRRNKVRQAISLHRARRTGTWWHPESYAEKRPVLGEAVFDPVAIDQAERHLLANEAGWRDYFRSCGVKPMTVVYEDLVADYEPTIRRALRFLEIAEADKIPIGQEELRAGRIPSSQAAITALPVRLIAAAVPVRS